MIPNMGNWFYSKIIKYSRQQKNISHLRKKKDKSMESHRLKSAGWEGISEFSWSIGGSSYMETFFFSFMSASDRWISDGISR